jgi:hypothetical protein
VATRWLAFGTVAGPVLFTVAWFVLGFLSPVMIFAGGPPIPASPITAPISGLGLGPTGPFMNAAFVIGGLLLTVGVFGVFQSSDLTNGRPAARWGCAALLALTGLGMAIDGIFTLESFLPHFVGFLLASGIPVLSFLAAGFFFRGFAHWQRFGNWLLLGSPLTLILLVVFQLTFDQTTIMPSKGSRA